MNNVTSNLGIITGVYLGKANNPIKTGKIKIPQNSNITKLRGFKISSKELKSSLMVLVLVLGKKYGLPICKLR
jgi:hypothetical protein